MRARRGLTIGELVIAIGLLAMALVTTMVLFGQILEVTSKNSLLAQGSYLADSLLERETQRLLAGEALRPSGSGSEKIPFRDETNGVDYTYTLDTGYMTDDHFYDHMGYSYWLRVQVEWWKDSSGASRSRVSYGNLSVKRTRVIYVPNKD